MPNIEVKFEGNSEFKTVECGDLVIIDGDAFLVSIGKYEGAHTHCRLVGLECGSIWDSATILEGASIEDLVAYLKGSYIEDAVLVKSDDYSLDVNVRYSFKI